MSLKKLKASELEEMTYNDIAFYIMKDRKTKIKVIDLFDKVATILKLTKKAKEANIADFYTSISTDKRFIALDGGLLDLKNRQSIKELKVEHHDFDPEEIIEIKSTPTPEAPDKYNELKQADDDVEEDELKDLVIISEDDIE